MKRYFYYIEVQMDGECVRRIPTTEPQMKRDLDQLTAEHPEMEVQIAVSSEKEKAINKLRYENKL